MKRFDIVLQRTLGVTSAVVLFAMMTITAVDVAGRYLFNRPIAGGFELTEILLAALIYCGLPLVSARREHIVIDTFDPLFSQAPEARPRHGRRGGVRDRARRRRLPDLPARRPGGRVRRHHQRAEAAAGAGGLPDGAR